MLLSGKECDGSQEINEIYFVEVDDGDSFV